MENTKEFFLSVIQRIFSNWTALKMAVEHGMGCKDNAVQFCPYILDFIYMNGESLHVSDIAIELEEYMDQHFNTQLEDDSPVQVATELMRFYKYCCDGNEATAVEELNKLLPLNTWITTREPISRRSAPRETSSESEEDEEEGMEVIKEEWTEVKARRNR
ncbi:pre-rRNA-processing protein TSR2 homolog [Prorops nasuta]|uniref:pre-rRNA-processing protein TSR2 homolog n=1 Tax=Prorops nasuta TaxID=863751 RepID=UPI0034CFFB71